MKDAMRSLLQLLLTLTLLSVGALLLSPSEPSRKVLAAVTLAAGVISLLGFYFLERGKMLTLKSGVEVHPDLVKRAIQEVLSEVENVEVEGKTGIVITVRALPEERYAQAEEQLTLLLRQRFGYTSPFILRVL